MTPEEQACWDALVAERDRLSVDRDHWVQESSLLAKQRDALISAARKVACWRCCGRKRIATGDIAQPSYVPCPDCADLRTLLEAP